MTRLLQLRQIVVGVDADDKRHGPHDDDEDQVA
jgi:hypothetical protein